MDKKNERFIQYALRKSQTVQSVRQRGIEMAWLKFEFFLKQFTTAKPESPLEFSWDSIELSIFSGFDDQKTDDKCWTAINLANEKFGSGQVINVQAAHLYKSPPKKETIWRLKQTQYKEAVDILIAGDPWPPQEPGLGPVELRSVFDFFLKDPRTKDVLPLQIQQSVIMFWLTRNSYCSPTLNFPFDTPDDKFWNYLKEIEPFLPFKFEAKNLRLISKNKKGTGYNSRKL